MRRAENEKLFFSPSDLVTYLGCSHASVFDLQHLFSPQELPPETDGDRLLKSKGLQHEREYLRDLHERGLRIAEIPSDVSITKRVELTQQAMADGFDVIYQAALARPPWNGFADFLLRVDGRPSKFGSYSYDVADTKLALSAKSGYVIQLCVYCDMLEAEQGVPPRELHIVLGNKKTVSLHVEDFRHYQTLAARRFEAFMASPPPPSAGEPCQQCEHCRWSDRCEAEWERTEHLSLVANITSGQIKKLRAAGVNSMRDLAQMPQGQAIPKMTGEILSRLQQQARLQLAKREDGQNHIDLLPLAASKGFARLPPSDAGDLFFDMEGYPLYDNERKLEYLFGFVFVADNGTPEFKAFWAHDREAEKKAFEDSVDFIMARLAVYPNAYVYHYASYEETALKTLAMIYGTREAEVDQLLRGRKLVDLYKVVREAIRVSEPRYSIKNMEHFYAEKRAGEVTNAGDSIAMYEKWRVLRDASILKEISDYNEFDCRSTLMCRDWLLSMRPAEGVSWFSPSTGAETTPEKENARREAEMRTSALIGRLCNGVSDEERPWRELVGQLLEFHRREAKPQYWAMFSRQDMSDDELVEDAESIGKLVPDPTHPPYADKKSKVFTYTFPPQDFKMRAGDTPLRSGTLEPAGEIVSLDDKARRISLKLGPSRTPLPDVFSLVPSGPIGDQILRDAVYRYAEAVAAGRQDHYAGITSILRKETPRLTGLTLESPIIPPQTDLLEGAVDALCRLDHSHLLVQGPPGTGKTYTSSHAVAELLARGKRIGIASNSHKAINNLLFAIEKQAQKRGLRFNGIKKSSNQDQFLDGAGMIKDTTDAKEASNGGYQLVAGTAWLFARPEFDQTLDFLFIDEAGQVSLANIVAMGCSAKNIILVGDQMQLSQPIQGTHPGSSGLSALEYLLGDASTVPVDKGIFLSVTRRMHPQICQFISDAVYDGRLQPGLDNGTQRLLPTGTEDAEAIAAAGLRFIDVGHEGCTQKSEEEAQRLLQTYNALIGMPWVDDNGAQHTITQDDILVVTPYNMQVDLLERTLPAGARVGTVDKFQGQEAAVVLISMVTSSGEDLPRNIEFLFSRNRLNVAISRARCLAVIYANPRLLEVSCNSIEQMRLVNTLCWAKTYAATTATQHLMAAVA